MNARPGQSRWRRPAKFAAAFLAGTIAGMLLLAQFQKSPDVDVVTFGRDEAGGGRRDPPNYRGAAPGTSGRPPAAGDRETRLRPPAAPLDSAGASPLSAAAIAELRARNLTVPVDGVTLRDLQDTFGDTRDSVRQHEALDILAPLGTRVIAVEDGIVAKLFTSERGGLTIYQFDPTHTYAYYYAHLDRYAPGLQDNMRVTRGQLLGFVGTTGNAPKDTPHLHFAISLLADKRQWWQGTPVNPFEAWR